jgi:hypothetical protein
MKEFIGLLLENITLKTENMALISKLMRHSEANKRIDDLLEEYTKQYNEPVAAMGYNRGLIDGLKIAQELREVDKFGQKVEVTPKSQTLTPEQIEIIKKSIQAGASIIQAEKAIEDIQEKGGER